MLPLNEKPERGYIRMFSRNENRNEGTFACSPGTKAGTKVRSPKPPFYKTALSSSSEIDSRESIRRKKTIFITPLSDSHESPQTCDSQFLLNFPPYIFQVWGVLGDLFLLFAFEALALSLSCVAACIACRQAAATDCSGKLLGRALCHLVGCLSRP